MLLELPGSTVVASRLTWHAACDGDVMLAKSSICDLTLATLVALGCGCVIHNHPNTAPAPQHGRTANGPKKSDRPKQIARAPGKPAKPGKATPADPPGSKPAKPKPPKPHAPDPTDDHPGKPETRPGPRPDVRPAEPDVPAEPNATNMVVPVRVAFAETVEKVDESILRTVKQDWQTVSAPGSLTRVEVRYRVWRDPIAASFADRTLKVGVNAYYAADVRVSAKNPLGGRIWITRGESWGTKSDPQKISAKFSAKFDIQDDYRVKARVELDDLDHGPAPRGDLCVQAITRVCVSKEAIAPMVNRHLDRYLVPRIEKALDDADQHVERSLNLKRQAQQLWGALQQPRALQKLAQPNCPTVAGAVCNTPAWLVVQPTAVGVSQPRKDGGDLRVDLAFAGKFAVQLGDKPKVKPTKLPPLKPVTDPPGFAVRARLRVPVAVLGEELSQRLKGKHVGRPGSSELIVTHVTLVEAPDLRPTRRLHLVVTTRGAFEGELQMWGELAWDPKKRELSLKNFDYALDTDNQAVKRLSAANHAALLALVAEQARWKLDARTAVLGEAITGALGSMWEGHLSVDGELDRVQVENLDIEKEFLAADLVLAGQLEIGFKP